MIDTGCIYIIANIDATGGGNQLVLVRNNILLLCYVPVLRGRRQL